MATKKVTLKASDNEVFEVEQAIAMKSRTLMHMMEDCSIDSAIAIPIHNVKGKILAKVIEYMNKHKDDIDDDNEYPMALARKASSFERKDQREKETELKRWDEEFMRVEQETLFDLIWAANYMEIKSLLELGCQAIADMMKGKTVEEIRQTFHIKNDFTPAEEEKVREENFWAFL